MSQLLQLYQMDARSSVEHQIEIHVNDLFEVHYYAKQPGEETTDEGANSNSNNISSSSGKPNHDLALSDVLAGLRYVMEYRIKGGKLRHLSEELMRRLAEALLIFMQHKERRLQLLRQKLTPDADVAFLLFGEFVEEVEEFRQAVSQVPLADLRHALKIHRRTNNFATQEQRDAAVAMIAVLSAHLAPYLTWRDLVHIDAHDRVESLLQNLPLSHKTPQQHQTTTMTSDNDVKQPPISPRMPTSQRPVLPPPSLYFDRTIDRLLDMFGLDPNLGLSSSRLEKLFAHYGPNSLPPPPPFSPWKLLASQLMDLMVIVLVAASVASYAIKDFKSGSVLLVVVMINTTIGFWQEFKAGRALEALMSLSVPKATVLRDGKVDTIDSSELVPGDVVILEEGDAVPADLRIIECAQLEIVESILTGESVGVAKGTDVIRARSRKVPLAECKNTAFMSTVVARGRGKGIVVRTGSKTEIGKITSAISSTPDVKTPMQIRLARLGIYLVIVSIALCALVIVLGLVYDKDAMRMVVVGVSLAVSVIPEGLVTVVTITFALGVRRMAARQAIVRKLPSVETLGSVSTICSDKTGTLTEGKMTATECWTSDREQYSFTAKSLKDAREGDAVRGILTSLRGNTDVPILPKSIEALPQGFATAMIVAGLCNNSSFQEKEGKIVAIGDPTEAALLGAAIKAGLSPNNVMSALGVAKKIEFAFDSDRKLMSCVYASDKHDVILAKGAPEAVLSRCSHYFSPSKVPSPSEPALSDSNGAKATFDLSFNGSLTVMTDAFLNEVSKESSRMATSGLRVLGLAIRPISRADADKLTNEDVKIVEKDLCFVGLVGLIDPPREGVRESVETCRRAGIKVVMITGDHVATATAVAKKLGIMLDGSGGAIQGAELDVLSEDSLAALKPFPSVFARVSPDNKLKIVKALQSRGDAVAMTGDGVNDAPAIKAANVGVAMGMAGTEITKQAADIILANDNFTTIVAAVEEGRRVFDNIQKFILYLLSCNFAEIFVMLVAVAIGEREPFTAMMILFANIIADIPPSLSLGMEPVGLDVMERPPRSPKEGVLTLKTSFIIAFQSCTMGLLALGVYLWQLALREIPRRAEDNYSQTVTFVALTLMQLLQSFYSRSVELSVFKTGVTGNLYMVGAFFFSFSVILMAVYVPPIARFFELVPVKLGRDWAMIFGASCVHLIVVEMFKFGLRIWSRRQKEKVNAQRA